MEMKCDSPVAFFIYLLTHNTMRDIVSYITRYYKKGEERIVESQFRRGILEVCVLAVLERGESYGYKLVMDISEFIPITESTLYPILKRLETSDMLAVNSQEHNGRLRKYYRITEQGREHLTELLEEWEEILKVYHFIMKERKER